MMKKRMILLLTVFLVLSLAACGGRTGPTMPESPSSQDEEPAVPTTEEPLGEEPSSQPETEREWNLKPGKVLHYDHPERESDKRSYSLGLGTEKEMAEFKALLRTADISYLEAWSWTDIEAELPVETEMEILRTLESAQPEFFERMENPATGGTYGVNAYDQDGKELFGVGYDGFWFAVTIYSEETAASYIFDGSRMNLNLPSLEKYRSDSPFYGLDPGEIIPLEDERLMGPVNRQYGTQENLDRWYALIQTTEINHMAVNRMNDAPGELSVEIEGQIRTLLQNVEVALYPEETREDPVTGGGITIIAYDRENQKLFYTAFIGNWFLVQFGEEDISYIFNGEASEALEYLASIQLS